MDNQRLVEAILRKYRPGMELEIRMPAIKDTFELMFTELVKIGGELDCSVNIISNNVFEKLKSHTKYIRCIEYKNGISIDKYYQKTSLGHVDNIKYKHHNYRLSLNEEKPCPKFNPTPNATVRAKLRYSCQVGDWRFDLTAVRQGELTTMSSQFVAIKRDLIESNLDNFLSQCTKFGKYEIELEYMGMQPMVESLNIVATAAKYMGTNYESTALLDDELQQLASVLSERAKTFKTIVNQAEQLNKLKYISMYPLENYWGVIKVDGERAIISINGNRCRILRSNSCIELPCDLYAPGLITLADIEICDNICYVIDVLIVDSKEVHTMPFEERITYQAKVETTISGFMKVGKHEYIALNNVEEVVTRILNAKYEHPTDGIIFTSSGRSYKNTLNLKWKSFEHNTIDFLVKSCPTSLIGKSPYINIPGHKLYLLFSNINHTMRMSIGLGLMQNYTDVIGTNILPHYYPVQFSPSMDPLAYLWYVSTDDETDYVDKVVELGKDNELNWKFVRVRDDKESGNDFRIAETTYVNYIDRFDVEELWVPSSIYFTKSKDKLRAAEVRTKRLIISVLLKEKFSHCKWIIDLAGGRGADLHTWQNIGVSNMLNIDSDSSAISELLRRKYESMKTKRGGNDIAPRATVGSTWNFNYETLIVKQKPQLTIHTLVANLTTKSVDMINACRQYGISTELVDGINCGFALHYLCNTEENILNILTFIHSMLRKGSLFMFTVMDGEKVFKLLKNVVVWEVKQHEVPKFRIRKLYKGTTMAHTGQEISILLPMDSEEKTEPLCNIGHIVSVAKKIGFELHMRTSFMDHIERVETMAKHIFDQLGEDDKKYIELHSIVILKKIK